MCLPVSLTASVGDMHSDDWWTLVSFPHASAASVGDIFCSDDWWTLVSFPHALTASVEDILHWFRFHRPCQMRLLRCYGLRQQAEVNVCALSLSIEIDLAFQTQSNECSLHVLLVPLSVSNYSHSCQHGVAMSNHYNSSR